MTELDDRIFKRLEKAAQKFASQQVETGDKHIVESGTRLVTESISNVERVNELLLQQQWLRQQLVEHTAALNAAKDTRPPSTEDFENLRIRVSDLQKELIDAHTDVTLTDLLLQRNQMSSTLSSTLFPEGGYDNESAEQEKVRKHMTTMVESQARYGSAILRIQQEIEGITPGLENTQKENLELLRENRKLMQDLKQVQAAHERTPRKDDHALKAAQESYEKTVSKINVVRHVFQALILGSGINWGADDEMTQLMVSLGTPLDKQLEKLQN